jgi:hypothetical protein
MGIREKLYTAMLPDSLAEVRTGNLLSRSQLPLNITINYEGKNCPQTGTSVPVSRTWGGGGVS